MTTQYQQRQLVLISLLLIFFVSCTSAPTPTVETAEPSATVKPNFTPTPSITKTPYQTRTPKADITILEESTSPDGVWTAMITRTIRGKNYNLHFEVQTKQNNQTWVVENLDFTEPENPLEGYKYPFVFKWSSDGKSLYYSHRSTGGDGCYGSSMFNFGGLDLIRFDLSSGDAVTIRDDWATWMVFSPDETKLAYISNWDGNVNVLELGSNKELALLLPSIPDEYGLVNSVEYAIWSPDGRALIYAYMWGSCGDYFLSYLIHVNLDTQKQTFLVERDEHGYIPIEWNIQDKIVLKDNDDNLWWLNPTTKEIVPAQP